MLYGKSPLAKKLGASQLIYSASLVSAPFTVINTAQSLFFSLLWKTGKIKLRDKLCTSHLKKGGLNFINFGIMVKSLH